MHDEPKPPRRLNDRIPRDLETVCLKAMAKEPNRRYATAGDLADDLRRFQNGEPIRARRSWAPERAWRWSRRNPAVASLLLLAAVLTVLVAILSTIAARKSTIAARKYGAKADRARTAEQKAKEQLEQTLEAKAQLALGQSRRDEGAALQRGGQIGQRFDSSDRLREALVLSDDPAELLVDLTVRVWTPGGGDKRSWKVDEAEALPVRPGDLVSLEGRLSQPAYVYLLWLDGQGKTFSFWPWLDRQFGSRPPSEVPLATVLSPEALGKGWPIRGPGGLETALLLARRTPLPAGTTVLPGVIGRLPPSPLRDLGEETERIDEPLLQLIERLRPHFEVIRAVRFAYQGD
jgi:hypothetical protein